MRTHVPTISLATVKEVKKNTYVSVKGLKCPHCNKLVTSDVRFKQYSKYRCPKCDNFFLFVGFTDCLPSGRRNEGYYYAELTWIN